MSLHSAPFPPDLQTRLLHRQVAVGTVPVSLGPSAPSVCPAGSRSNFHTGPRPRVTALYRKHFLHSVNCLMH